MIGFVCGRSRVALIGRLAVLLLVMPIVTGCGASTGKVSGQVIYQGKPLPGGIVMFRPKNAALNPVSAEIDANGKYEARVPAGECKVSVDNRSLSNPDGPSPVGAGGAPTGVAPKGVAIGPPKDRIATEGKDVTLSTKKAEGTYVPIPKSYYDPETSGLTLTVKSGGQTFDIELK
jgi:hypothetical protein